MDELYSTLGLLVVEIAVLAYLTYQSRKPPTPGQVRLFPYGALSLVVFVMILLTAAHLVSLLTGTQLQPRRPKGVR